MSIRTGDRAVAVSLPTKPGETIDLGQHIGHHPVVLLIFPLAFSSVCTDELCQIRDDWSAWQKLDAAVFGVTADSPFITDRYRQELNIPFPILSDFNRDLTSAYGALHDDLHGLRQVPKRAVFVIGADGTVKYDWVSDDPGKLPDFDAVRTALTQLATPTPS